MANQNNQTWTDILQFSEFNLQDVPSGRDVVTTLENRGSDSHLSTENIPVTDLHRETPTETQAVSFQELLNQETRNQRLRQQELRNQQQENRQEEVNMSENTNENTISLHDLFSRESSLDDSRNESVVSLRDLQETDVATTYTRPNLHNLVNSDGTIIEFGEEVIKVETGRVNGMLEIEKQGYEEFNHSVKNVRDQQRMQELQDTRIQQQEVRVKRIVEELFGTIHTNMYGYQKIGRTPEGVPYISAVLATRFNKLYDRRFRKPEEMNEYSRNVAVANRNQSVRSFIELTVTKDTGGNLTYSVVDTEGNSIPYLEQKFEWIKGQARFTPDTWVLYLKTQFEFEESFTTLDELLSTDFNERIEQREGD